MLFYCKLPDINIKANNDFHLLKIKTHAKSMFTPICRCLYKPANMQRRMYVSELEFGTVTIT